jgi:hypothetical protein
VKKDLHLEIIQVKEKREQRHTQVGFNRRKPQERVKLYDSFPYRIFHTHPWVTVETVMTSMGHSGESHGYPWVTEETKSWMPRKVCQNWLYNRSTFPG